MKRIIFVADYTDMAFDASDAQIVLSAIEEAIITSPVVLESIILDFSRIRYFTTWFFDELFSTLLQNFFLEEFKTKIQFLCLSKIGLHIYNLCMNNVENFYKVKG